MTFIKRLEIHGFKSFANKLSIDLRKGFSTFIGPNGSGKSNVIDALCFVLGKTSKKSMRASMLSDLIFNGGKNGRPAKFAEVSLVFDNESKIFPYDGDEFVITRKVLSKGNSVFKINGNIVKRQEVIDALLRANINPDGFNIILQGDIQKFVDLSPDERRKIIEDVSGVSVYEDKKKKSLRELEKVEDKLREANTLLAERERYLKEIVNDKKQAEKFLKLKSELRDKKAGLLFKQIHELEQQVGVITEDISKNQSIISDSETKIKEYQLRIDELTSELNNVKALLISKGDSKQKVIQQKLDDVKSKKLRLEALIDNHKNELDRIKQKKRSVKEELRANELEVKRKKELIKNLDLRLKSLKKEFELKKKSYGVEREEEVHKIREELLVIEEELSSLNNELVSAERSQEYADKLTRAINKRDSYNVNLKRVINSLSSLNKKKIDLINKKKEVSDFLFKLNNKKVRLEASKNALLDVGPRGVKEILRSGLPGVHGTIASLGIVNKQFNTALNVAVGGKLNAIVTSTDVDAKKCIEFLRRNQLGTASFIPLNKIKGFTPSSSINSLLKSDGVIGLAINLIKFDPVYRKAFELILRDTIIVNDLDVARRIGFGSVRVVTLKGDVIEPGGLMTGGFRRSNFGFSSEDINQQLSEVDESIRKYEHYLNELSITLESIEESIIKEREEKARIESLLNEVNLVINDLEPRVLKVNVESINSRISELINRKKELRSKLDNTLSEDALRAAKEELKELSSAINELVIERNTAESELNKVLIKEGERWKSILAELDKEFKSFSDELINAKNELISVNNELKNLRLEESRYYKELKELYNKRDSIIKEIDKVKGFINNLEKKNYSIKERIQSLNLKRASLLARLDGLKVSFEQYSDWEPRLFKKSVKDIQQEINKLEVIINNFGPVNMKSLETYQEVEKEFEEIKSRVDKLSSEREDIINVINGIEDKKKRAFIKSFNSIKNSFERLFAKLSPGGIGKLILENPDNPFEGGVIVMARPKGKKILTLKSMSGGEKTLTALAFIFAIQEFSPTPFYILDEVDAALDKANTEKLAEMLAEQSANTQFIAISHNDELISAANYLYGVSMDKRGVSNIVSIELPED